MTNSVINAMTIDFEDWYQGLEIPCSQWSGFEDRIHISGRRLLEVLAEVGIRATFFVLGYVAERHPGLIREIAAAGHEIGTHGYSHTLIYTQTREVFREELRRAVHVVEDAVGSKILGHRAPFFSVTRRSMWAIDVLSELGIAYDSSIFPVRNYRYGIEDAPRAPYDIKVGERTVKEFPISTWRLLGRNLPIAGGAYFRILPYPVTRAGLRSVNREGQPAVFYIHPWEFDPEHPRIALPRRIAATHYFNLKATSARYRKLLRDFRFAPMREILNAS